MAPPLEEDLKKIKDKMEAREETRKYMQKKKQERYEAQMMEIETKRREEQMKKEQKEKFAHTLQQMRKKTGNSRNKRPPSLISKINKLSTTNAIKNNVMKKVNTSTEKVSPKLISSNVTSPNKRESLSSLKSSQILDSKASSSNWLLNSNDRYYPSPNPSHQASHHSLQSKAKTSDSRSLSNSTKHNPSSSQNNFYPTETDKKRLLKSCKSVVTKSLNQSLSKIDINDFKNPKNLSQHNNKSKCNLENQSEIYGKVNVERESYKRKNEIVQSPDMKKSRESHSVLINTVSTDHNSKYYHFSYVEPPPPTPLNASFCSEFNEHNSNKALVEFNEKVNMLKKALSQEFTQDMLGKYNEKPIESDNSSLKSNQYKKNKAKHEINRNEKCSKQQRNHHSHETYSRQQSNNKYQKQQSHNKHQNQYNSNKYIKNSNRTISGKLNFNDSKEEDNTTDIDSEQLNITHTKDNQHKSNKNLNEIQDITNLTKPYPFNFTNTIKAKLNLLNNENNTTSRHKQMNPNDNKEDLLKQQNINQNKPIQNRELNMNEQIIEYFNKTKQNQKLLQKMMMLKTKEINEDDKNKQEKKDNKYKKTLKNNENINLSIENISDDSSTINKETNRFTDPNRINKHINHHGNVAAYNSQNNEHAHMKNKKKSTTDHKDDNANDLNQLNTNEDILSLNLEDLKLNFPNKYTSNSPSVISICSATSLFEFQELLYQTNEINNQLKENLNYSQIPEKDNNSNVEYSDTIDGDISIYDNINNKDIQREMEIIGKQIIQKNKSKKNIKETTATNPTNKNKSKEIINTNTYLKHDRSKENINKINEKMNKSYEKINKTITNEEIGTNDYKSFQVISTHGINNEFDRDNKTKSHKLYETKQSKDIIKSNEYLNIIGQFTNDNQNNDNINIINDKKSAFYMVKSKQNNQSGVTNTHNEISKCKENHETYKEINQISIETCQSNETLDNLIIPSNINLMSKTIFKEEDFNFRRISSTPTTSSSKQIEEIVDDNEYISDILYITDEQYEINDIENIKENEKNINDIKEKYIPNDNIRKLDHKFIYEMKNKENKNRNQDLNEVGQVDNESDNRNTNIHLIKENKYIKKTANVSDQRYKRNNEQFCNENLKEHYQKGNEFINKNAKLITSSKQDTKQILNKNIIGTYQTDRNDQIQHNETKRNTNVINNNINTYRKHYPNDDQISNGNNYGTQMSIPSSIRNENRMPLQSLESRMSMSSTTDTICDLLTEFSEVTESNDKYNGKTIFTMKSKNLLTPKFSLKLLNEMIKAEEERQTQSKTILKLRAKGLTDKIMNELTRLEYEKKNIKSLSQPYNEIQNEKIKNIKKKQRGYLLKLKQEQDNFNAKYKQLLTESHYRIKQLTLHYNNIKMEIDTKTVLKQFEQSFQMHDVETEEQHEHFEEENFDTTLPSNIEKLKTFSSLPEGLDRGESAYKKIKAQDVTTSTAIEFPIKPKAVKDQCTSPLRFVSTCDISKLEEPLVPNTTTDIKKNEVLRSGNEMPTKATLYPKYLRRLSSGSDDSFIYSQNETISDQSDLELRIQTLKDQLNKRKYESERLKKELKNIRKENLKTKEFNLLQQIKSYDKFIESSIQELNNEKQNRNQSSNNMIKPLILKPTKKIVKKDNKKLNEINNSNNSIVNANNIAHINNMINVNTNSIVSSIEDSSEQTNTITSSQNNEYDKDNFEIESSDKTEKNNNDELRIHEIDERKEIGETKDINEIKNIDNTQKIHERKQIQNRQETVESKEKINDKTLSNIEFKTNENFNNIIEKQEAIQTNKHIKQNKINKADIESQQQLLETIRNNDTKINAVEKKSNIIQHEDKILKQNKLIDDLVEIKEIMRDSSNDVETETEQIETDIEPHTEQIETDLENTETNIEQTKTDSGHIKSDIEQIETDIEQVETDLEQIETDMDQTETDIEQIDDYNEKYNESEILQVSFKEKIINETFIIHEESLKFNNQNQNHGTDNQTYIIGNDTSQNESLNQTFKQNENQYKNNKLTNQSEINLIKDLNKNKTNLNIPKNILNVEEIQTDSKQIKTESDITEDITELQSEIKSEVLTSIGEDIKTENSINVIETELESSIESKSSIKTLENTASKTLENSLNKTSKNTSIDTKISNESLEITPIETKSSIKTSENNSVDTKISNKPSIETNSSIKSIKNNLQLEENQNKDTINEINSEIESEQRKLDSAPSSDYLEEILSIVESKTETHSNSIKQFKQYSKEILNIKREINETNSQISELSFNHEKIDFESNSVSKQTENFSKGTLKDEIISKKIDEVINTIKSNDDSTLKENKDKLFKISIENENEVSTVELKNDNKSQTSTKDSLLSSNKDLSDFSKESINPNDIKSESLKDFSKLTKAPISPMSELQNLIRNSDNSMPLMQLSPSKIPETPFLHALNRDFQLNQKHQIDKITNDIFNKEINDSINNVVQIFNKITKNNERKSLNENETTLNQDKTAQNNEKGSIKENKTILNETETVLNKDKITLNKNKITLNDDENNIFNNTHETHIKEIKKTDNTIQPGILIPIEDKTKNKSIINKDMNEILNKNNRIDESSSESVGGDVESIEDIPDHDESSISNENENDEEDVDDDSFNRKFNFLNLIQHPKDLSWDGSDADWYNEDFGLALEGSPDIVAEVLLQKERQLDQEIEKIKQLTSSSLPEEEQIQSSSSSSVYTGYPFVREIPDKPPPPYIEPVSSVPTSEQDIKNLVTTICEDLYNPSTKSNIPNSNIVRIQMYYSFLYDLTKEIYNQVTNETNVETNIPWEKERIQTFIAKKKILNKKEDIISYVLNEINLIFQFNNENNYQLKRPNENLIINWSKQNRDPVDQIIIEQSKNEEIMWTNFYTQEMEIKNILTEQILNELIQETIQEFQKIDNKRNKCTTDV